MILVLRYGYSLVRLAGETYIVGDLKCEPMLNGQGSYTVHARTLLSVVPEWIWFKVHLYIQELKLHADLEASEQQNKAARKLEELQIVAESLNDTNRLLLEPMNCLIGSDKGDEALKRWQHSAFIISIFKQGRAITCAAGSIIVHPRESD